MKTVLVDKNGTVSVAEIPKPKYGPKQALTKTIANGICGTDVHLMKRKIQRCAGKRVSDHARTRECGAKWLKSAVR